MNLLSINLLSNKFKSLNKFDKPITFDESPKDLFDPICLVGLNGSGKSHFMELLAECFMISEYYFRNNRFPAFEKEALLFELEYSLDASGYTEYIKLDRKTTRKLKVYKRNEEDEYVEDSTFSFNLLPKKIIGYSSGMNETLSSPFLQIQDDFAKILSNVANNVSRYHDIVDPVRMLYLDSGTNLLLVVSNLIFNQEKSVLNKYTNIKRLKEFDIEINKDIRVEVKTNSQLEGIIEDLGKCSILPDVSSDQTSYSYKYIVDENLKKAVSEIFGKQPMLFFDALVLLNNLNILALNPKYLNWVRQKRKDGFIVKAPVVPDNEKFFKITDLVFETEDNVLIEYEGLSDGEHQLIQTLGTLNLIEEADTLFLFDEPDTHYNPEWRSKLLSEYSNVSKERNQEVIISTHSPFLVSSIRSRMVYHFEKGRKPLIDHPLFETFGSPINTINNRLFGGIGIVPDLPVESMKELAKKEPDEILESIDRYGESPQKAILYKIISEHKK